MAQFNAHMKYWEARAMTYRDVIVLSSACLWIGACGKTANEGTSTTTGAGGGCTYAGHQYLTGAQFVSEDGCNTCSCSAIGNVVCTQESCVQPDADASISDASLNNGATYINAASTHACAFVKGTLYCWGANDSGQLGNATNTSSLTPTPVKGLGSGVQQVAANNTTCTIVAGATLCWGDNSHGTLGDNATAASSVPVQVQGLTSSSHSIAVGALHACAAVNGAALCWGNNAYGQLGDGTTTNEQVPVPVQGLTSGVTAVAVGLIHSCAVVNGAAYCWGDNESAQLGNGTCGQGLMSTVPEPVQGLTSGITAIAAGYLYTCAVASGVIYCWGNDVHGQLGGPSTIPSPLGGQPGIGYCNEPGSVLQQLCSLVPLQVQGLPSGVESVTAGIDHTCAVANGAAYCWGADDAGQLGDGNFTNVYQPVQVQGLTAGVTAISANGYDNSTSYNVTCAVANGDVYCWGSNAYGQLGNGTTVDSAVPIKVQFP